MREAPETDDRAGPVARPRAAGVWLLLAAAGVGAGAGAVGAVFRLLVLDLTEARVRLAAWTGAAGGPAHLLPVAATALALTASVLLVRRLAPEAAGSGVHEIKGVLAGTRPMRWRRILPVKFVGGVLALGGGAVLGTEGPTVQMGGAVGGMVAEARGGGTGRTRLLVAVGAAAGLSAAFNAPLAGILFVIEALRPHLAGRVLGLNAVFVGAVVADMVVRTAHLPTPLIPVSPGPPVPVAELWAFVPFGVLLGALGVGLVALLLATDDWMRRLPDPGGWRVPLGVGLVLGTVGVEWPGVLGSGYGAAQQAMAGHLAGTALATTAMVRVAATALSFGTGAPGGILARVVALGALGGAAFGAAFGALPAWLPVAPPEVFAVAGIAAVFTAAVQAPVTAVVLAAEVTGGVTHLLPLIVTALSAIVTARALRGRPVFTVLLERARARGPLPPPDVPGGV